MIVKEDDDEFWRMVEAYPDDGYIEVTWFKPMKTEKLDYAPRKDDVKEIVEKQIEEMRK